MIAFIVDAVIFDIYLHKLAGLQASSDPLWLPSLVRNVIRLRANTTRTFTLAMYNKSAQLL